MEVFVLGKWKLKTVGISIVVAIPLVFIGLWSAAWGEGSYTAFAVLFPYHIYFMKVGASIDPKSIVAVVVSFSFLVLMPLQYLVYGMSIGWAREKRKLGEAIFILISIHFIAALGALLLLPSI